MKRMRRFWLGLLAALVITGCVAPDMPAATPFPEQDAPAAAADVPWVTCMMDGQGPYPSGDDAYELLPGECIVANQLILSGERGQIDELLAEYGDQLSPPDDERVLLDYAELVDEDVRSMLPIYSFLRGRDPVSRLVTILDGSVMQFMAETDLRDRTARVGILVDYNYLLGTATSCTDEVTGMPHSVGAHPHSVGAHPHSVGAHPFDTAVAGVVGDEAMRGQWALGDGPGGIQLFVDDAGSPVRTTENTGDGAQVVIFDTSPFAQPNVYDLPVVMPGSSNEMVLTVTHPAYFRDIRPSPDIVDPVRMENHGLFAAGLVHAVAPGAQIELVRVLNEYGQGDLFTLLYAVVDLLKNRDAQVLSKTVVNFSLGIVAPCAVLTAEDIAQLQSFLDGLGYPEYSDDEVRAVALDGVISLLVVKGATVVAAAGNDSAEKLTAYAANPPAAYTNLVLGVMANGQAGERACYSNLGAISAPGGNPLDPEATTASCHPRTIELTCDGIEPCSAAVLSTVLDASGELGYAYWAGTSFATPLVSGICALAVSVGNPVCRMSDAVEAMTCPAQAGATLTGSGDQVRVANVRVALGERVPLEVCDATVVD